MSKFLKRIGTKKLAYTFNITVHNIQLTVNVPIRVSILWKRRNFHSDKKKSETKSKYPISPSIGSADICETLTMTNTLYQEKSGNFLQKNANLQILASTESNKTKKLGEVKINLVEYMNQPAVQKFFPICGCPDKKAKVSLSIQGLLLGESLTENASDASGNSANVSDEEFSHLSEQESSVDRSLTKKPPVFRPISETTGEEKQRIVNLNLKVSILEKENQQIRSEKEDIKLQLKLLVDNTQKEREKFCEHSQKLDSEIEEIKYKNKKLEKKVERYKEKIKKIGKELEDALSEVQILKSKFVESEKVKLLDLIKTQKLENFNLKQEISQIKSELGVCESDKQALEDAKSHLQTLNLRSLNEISMLKAKVEELQESLVSTVPDHQVNKRKVEVLLQELRKEVEENRDQRDQVFAKNTDLLIEVQQLKKKYLESEESLKQKIRKLEFELGGLKEENSELNERLNDEIHKIKIFERKTITEKEEITDQISKINKNYKEAVQNNDILARTLRENERKFARNRSETEPNTNEKLQKTIQAYQSDQNRLKQELASIKEENKELKQKLKSFQREFEDFQNPTEGSSEVLILKQKLENSLKFFNIEKKELTEKNFLLNEENLLLQEKLNDQQKLYENQIMALKIQKISLEDTKKSTENTADYVTSLKEESYKQTVEMKKLEIKELKGIILKLQEELKDTERKYMDLKMSLANFDLEKQNVASKHREIQEQLVEYTNNTTTMEIEFFKANESLAKTLNENLDLINEIEYLKMQIFHLQNRRRRKNK